ncbi:MAG: class I SAM-dependent methyltransferase, partial [Lentisphaeria bacterium]|nr:class I SAM-dependent methyltransferase [Lentisphaeria bacterium]
MCAKTLQQDDRHFPGWQPFEQLAERYDAWFDTERGARVFRVEAQCIGDLLVDRPRPWLEVGVGTGRFAAMLHVDEGVDPSSAVLRFASQRGIRTSVGKAEDLPYADHRFGAVVLVVTICFLKDP